MWPPLPTTGLAGRLPPGSMAPTTPHAKRKVRRGISSPCASAKVGHKSFHPIPLCCHRQGSQDYSKSHAKDYHKDVVCTSKARLLRQLGLSTSELRLHMRAFCVVKLHSWCQGTMGLMGTYGNQNAWWPVKLKHKTS